MSLINSFPLDEQQRRAAMTLDRDVALAAGAGSGKTRTLVARYLHLLEQGHAPGEIAAITFTEKAAREMRNRIRAEAQKVRRAVAPEQRAHWSDIEADIDAAPIGTFHGLCARILRTHPAEAGIDPQFDVLDEGQAAVWQSRAIGDALNWAVDQESLKVLFESFTPDALAEVLDVLFGKRLDIDKVDAVTTRQRWNDALLERMRAFAEHEPVRAAVQHLRGLKGKALADDAGDKLAAQVEGLDALWDVFAKALGAREMLGAALALFRMRRDHMALNVGKKTSRAKESLRELQTAYDDMVDPWLGGAEKKSLPPDADVEEAAAQVVAALLALLGKALRLYEKAKRDAAALDFDDLEGMAKNLLAKPDIRARWQTQLKTLLVDEFQDTNERQRQIVDALAGANDGLHGRLFVVGDAKQSIYRFRGADVSVFNSLTRAIVARGGLSLSLDRTYRAHDVLVRALNEMLGALMGAQGMLRPFTVPFAALTAHRTDPQPGVRAPFVEFLCGLGEASDEARRAAAQLLARRLLELREQHRTWDQFALLFRASTGFAAYEDALEQASIPFVTVAGRGFYDRPEIRDLLNVLRALANPWDDLALAGLLRSPAFGLSDEALYRLRWTEGHDAPRAFRAALQGDLSGLSPDDQRQTARANDLITRLSAQVDRVPVAELLKAVLDETLYPAVLSAAGSRLQRNSEKLLDDAHKSAFVRVNEFLEYVETLNASGAREGESPAEAEGAVRLMTVHRAKGLQFPVVVIADASRAAPNVSDPVLVSAVLGLAPKPDRREQAPLAYALAKADNRAMEEAEALRLIYVAATRAEERLIVCGHQMKRGGKVWLKQMLEATGRSLDHLMQARGETFALPESSALVRMEAAAISEPPAAPATAVAHQPTLPPLAQTLYAPLTVGPSHPAEAEADDHEDTAPPWQPAAQQHEGLDGALVGSLLHQAIRRWTFPGDPNYAPLLQTAALNAGLADDAERARTLARVAELLGRLRADARWAELQQAERHHEVPYVTAAGRAGRDGILDLLYRTPDGGWRIVDFKSDALDSVEAAEQLARVSYSAQLRRYLQAAQQLLGAPVSAELCFLDVANTIYWKVVDAAVS